jgi:hypothetical protein
MFCFWKSAKSWILKDFQRFSRVSEDSINFKGFQDSRIPLFTPWLKVNNHHLLTLLLSPWLYLLQTICLLWFFVLEIKLLLFLLLLVMMMTWRL